MNVVSCKRSMIVSCSAADAGTPAAAGAAVKRFIACRGRECTGRGGGLGACANRPTNQSMRLPTRAPCRRRRCRRTRPRNRRSTIRGHRPFRRFLCKRGRCGTCMARLHATWHMHRSVRAPMRARGQGWVQGTASTLSRSSTTGNRRVVLRRTVLHHRPAQASRNDARTNACMATPWYA